MEKDQLKDSLKVIIFLQLSSLLYNKVGIMNHILKNCFTTISIQCYFCSVFHSAMANQLYRKISF